MSNPMRKRSLAPPEKAAMPKCKALKMDPVPLFDIVEAEESDLSKRSENNSILSRIQKLEKDIKKLHEERSVPYELTTDNIIEIANECTGIIRQDLQLHDRLNKIEDLLILNNETQEKRKALDLNSSLVLLPEKTLKSLENTLKGLQDTIITTNNTVNQQANDLDAYIFQNERKIKDLDNKYQECIKLIEANSKLPSSKATGRFIVLNQRKDKLF